MNRLFAFDHSYDAMKLPELPCTQGQENAVIRFPANPGGGGKDGLLVRVTPVNGAPWLGMFAFGDPTGRGLNELFSCPNRDHLGVISAGRGYIVDTVNSCLVSEVPAFPVQQVIPLLRKQLLLLLDFVTITAWSQNGCLWRTRRLSYDGLKIKEIGLDLLVGSGWDPTNPNPPDFQVELSTGKCSGGSSPRFV